LNSFGEETFWKADMVRIQNIYMRQPAGLIYQWKSFHSQIKWHFTPQKGGWALGMGDANFVNLQAPGSTVTQCLWYTAGRDLRHQKLNFAYCSYLKITTT